MIAGIDWEATIIALDTGQLPCGGGECRVLQLAASIAGGIPVSLYNTLPGLDYRTSTIVIKAIMHATWQTQARTNES